MGREIFCDPACIFSCSVELLPSCPLGRLSNSVDIPLRMEFLTRFFDRFFSSDTTLQQVSIGVEALPLTRRAHQHSDRSQLEDTITDQRQQLVRARSLLQSAAFLASYHQPSLARDIRDLLSEMEATSPCGGDSDTTQPGSAAWSLSVSGGRKVSA